MKLFLALGILTLFAIHGQAEQSSDWLFVARAFFEFKRINVVEAILCSKTDGLQLHRTMANASRLVHSASLLRIVHRVNIFDPNLNRRIGIFIDVSCDINHKLLLEFTDSRLFTNNISWLVWDPKGLLTHSYHKLSLSTYSDVSIACRNRIIRLAKFEYRMPLILYDVGVWRDDDFSIEDPEMKINLQNSVITGAILYTDDIYNRSIVLQQLQDDQYKPGSDVSNRFIYRNMLHLAYLFNFTLNVTETDLWGERASNGSWDGLMGLLQRREADFTITPLLPITQRLEVGYPMVSVLTIWMAAVVKQPRALGTYKAMILELAPVTWVCVACIMVLGTFLFIVTHTHGLHGSFQYNKSDSSFMTGIVQIVGIVTNQGLNVIPKGFPARIVCISLLVLGLVVSSHYNAATMTALLSPSPPVIKSLEQLMSSTTPISAVDAPYVKKEKPRQRVFRKIVVDRMGKGMKVCSLVEGLGTIFNGSAFLGSHYDIFRAMTENLPSDVICDLTVFNAGFYQDSGGFTKKCPHLRELFSRGMMRTLEHGLMVRERQNWIADQPVCSPKSAFIHVRLEAVSVAVGIFFIGIVLSLFSLILEVLRVRHRGKRRITEKNLLNVGIC